MRTLLVLPRVRQSNSWINRWCPLLACIVGGLLLGGFLLSAHAQIQVPDIETLSPSRQVEEGIRLLRDGRTQAAISMLGSALRVDSALTVPSHGAAAYWLGKAYKQAEQLEEARTTWQTGLRALRADGSFDVRLADAYLQQLTPEQLRGERLYAADIYATLLRRVGTDTSEAAQALFRRRISQLEPLMSDELLDRVIKEDRSTETSRWTFRPDAGPALAKWWRSLDPLPATDENERLEEHLMRLVHVQTEFSCSERMRALDDRGIVYLRFGAPYKQRALNYEDVDFFQEVYRFGVPVPPSGFPKSEIWLYTHIDESGYYLFAEEGSTDCFSISKANDLIPSNLTMQRPDTKRGLNIGYSAMMAMRAIYRELALYHINFSSRFTDIANYVGWQQMKASLAEAAERTGREYQGMAGERSTVVGAGVGQTRRVFSNTTLGYGSPNDFVARLTMRAERADREAAERREEAMPRQHTTLFEGAAHLPVAVRTARFLNTDGTTRTEIYWGVPVSGLRLDTEGDPSAEGPSLITFSAVQYNGHHQSRQQKNREYQVDVRGRDGAQRIVPPPVTFQGLTAPYHLGMQWEQYELWQRESSSAGIPSLGRKRRIATARIDSLQPLRTEGPRVEMSDVKVMTLPDTSAQTLARPMEHGQPYPFRNLSTDTPLLLAFEVYHLTYGRNDRTRYTIAYEAEGVTRRGWTRLFRGNEIQSTSTEMTMEGSARRTRESILLDLAEINQGEPQTVRVTVRVTDEVTGSSVSRNVNFVLQPDDQQSRR